jgi:tryptophanyl-tRNA synthetase
MIGTTPQTTAAQAGISPTDAVHHAGPARPTTALPPATRVVTGLTASGRLHLGNYLGAIQPLLRLAADPGTHALVFVADVHALTLEHDPAQLRARTRELAATLLACGLDADATLFVQSAVPAHIELGHLLESAVTYGELTRMIQFKVKGDGQESVRAALLTYPALMAADILVHQADAVPVGEDQRQHLELTRTIAQRFNARYGEVFTVPDGIVPPTAARIRDLRNPLAKMGKSTAGPGTVCLTDTPVRLAAAVRAAVTDLDPELSYDPDLRPGVANLAEILGAATDRTPQAALLGLHGSGALKAAVTQALVETLQPVRERYTELIEDPAALDAVLAAGARAAAEHAAPTLTAARRALGLA